MSFLVGAMYINPLMPGLTGTVVNVNVSSGMWGRSAPTYDVLWDDMQCSRRISQDSLESGSQVLWQILPERRSEAECARMWHAYQIHRIAQMASQASARASAQAVAGVAVAPTDPPPPPRGQSEAEHTLVRAGAREVAAYARQMLARQIPGAQFAVRCSRQKLDVSWIDGPVEGYAWRVLATLRDKGVVEEVRVRRALSSQLVQHAIEYCFGRVFVGEPSPYVRLRVTPQHFIDGDLSAVLCEAGSSVTYQALLRCALERWDASRKRFVDTAHTRGLVQEMALLFPSGDAEATARFLALDSEAQSQECVLVRRLRSG